MACLLQLLDRDHALSNIWGCVIEVDPYTPYFPDFSDHILTFCPPQLLHTSNVRLDVFLRIS